MKIEVVKISQICLIVLSCVLLYSKNTLYFYSKYLHIAKNKNGLGGELLYDYSNEKIEIYSFEKSIKYLVSPDAMEIAINDIGGTASFSIIIFNSLKKKMILDDELYKNKPILEKYSNVYPVIDRWVTNDVLLLDVTANGPFEKKIPKIIHFKVAIKIPALN